MKPIVRVMKFIRALLFLSLTLGISFSSFAEEAEAPLCANDLNGIKGSSDQLVNKSIQASRDPLMMSFMKYKADLDKLCDDNKSRPFYSQAISLIAEFAPNFSISPANYIKKSCIQASLQRDISQNGYACINGKSTKAQTIDGRKKACLSQNSVDFIHYSVNTALKCFASIDKALDARFIMKKFNNETGFNFFYSYGGGTGIGQLISYPVRDIGGQGKGDGNARFVLEDIAASQDPACAPFQKIASGDLAKPPASTPSRNVCSYVGADTGFARNLIYSFGYYLHNRENYIKRGLLRRAPELIKNKDIVNYLTLLAYGPDGPSYAQSFIRNKRLNNKSNPNNVIELLKKETYVKATENKMKELLKELHPGEKNFSGSDMRGDSCVAR